MTKQYPKEEYQRKMRTYVNALRARLDEIEARLDQTHAVIEVDNPAETIDHAHNKGETAKDHLAEIEPTGVSGWEELRTGLEAAWDELKSAMVYLEQRFVDDMGAQESNQQHDE